MKKQALFQPARCLVKKKAGSAGCAVVTRAVSNNGDPDPDNDDSDNDNNDNDNDDDNNDNNDDDNDNDDNISY